MSSTWFAATLAFAAGLGGAVQIAVQGDYGGGPRIGVVATTAFLIAAQFGLATAIDRYGWFGVERVEITWARVLGIGLLVVGTAPTLRR